MWKFNELNTFLLVKQINKCTVYIISLPFENCKDSDKCSSLNCIYLSKIVLFGSANCVERCIGLIGAIWWTKSWQNTDESEYRRSVMCMCWCMHTVILFNYRPTRLQFASLFLTIVITSIMSRSIEWGRNALMAVVCPSVCLSRAWHYVEKGRGEGRAGRWKLTERKPM